MKNPKVKGGGWERVVAKLLSLWVSNGQQIDCFWRSAMSGGRATVARSKGKEVRQSGDICAVAPEGHRLTNVLYIECKFLKNCSIDLSLEGKGELQKIWKEACTKAHECQRLPVLIIKRNYRKPLWITCVTVAKMLNTGCRGGVSYPSRITNTYNLDMCVFLLDDVLNSTPPKSWTNDSRPKAVKKTGR